MSIPDQTSPRKKSQALSRLLTLMSCLVLLLLVVRYFSGDQAKIARLEKENTELEIACRSAESRANEVTGLLAESREMEKTIAKLHTALAGAEAKKEINLNSENPLNPADAEELQKVVAFLREELKAAHETIDRLKSGPVPAPR